MDWIAARGHRAAWPGVRRTRPACGARRRGRGDRRRRAARDPCPARGGGGAPSRQSDRRAVRRGAAQGLLLDALDGAIVSVIAEDPMATVPAPRDAWALGLGVGPGLASGGWRAPRRRFGRDMLRRIASTRARGSVRPKLGGRRCARLRRAARIWLRRPRSPRRRRACASIICARRAMTRAPRDGRAREPPSGRAGVAGGQARARHTHRQAPPPDRNGLHGGARAA